MQRYVRVSHAGSQQQPWVVLSEQRAGDASEYTLLSDAPWLGGTPLGLAAGSDAALELPLAPSKIICVAKNYREHAKEMQGDVPSEPQLFFKPPSSLLKCGGEVVLPPNVERTDFEAELGVVIGSAARDVAVADAMTHVFGYCVVCDVTARDYQKRDRLWTRAKGFDTFCPLGPEIVAGLDPSALTLKLWQNGELRQDGNTRDMVFTIAEVIAFASTFMTLLPGDLIATGTPHGVGPLHAGDQIQIEVEGLEPLSFSVAASNR